MMAPIYMRDTIYMHVRDTIYMRDTIYVMFNVHAMWIIGLLFTFMMYYGVFYNVGPMCKHCVHIWT